MQITHVADMHVWNRMCCIVAVCVSLPFLSGCSSRAPESSSTRDTASPTARAAPVRHSVIGQAPPTTNGMASIVILEPDPMRELPRRPEESVMDQNARVFSPDVLIVQTGQPVAFRNSDDELHNVDVKDATTKDQAFNVAIPMGQVYQHIFTRPGFYDVRCDIHTEMYAFIVAASTPYAKLADADGHFEFDDVQPGTYTVTAYAGSSKRAQPVDVRGSRTDITFRN